MYVYINTYLSRYPILDDISQSTLFSHYTSRGFRGECFGVVFECLCVCLFVIVVVVAVVCFVVIILFSFTGALVFCLSIACFSLFMCSFSLSLSLRLSTFSFCFCLSKYLVLLCINLFPSFGHLSSLHPSFFLCLFFWGFWKVQGEVGPEGPPHIT